MFTQKINFKKDFQKYEFEFATNELLDNEELKALKKAISNIIYNDFLTLSRYEEKGEIKEANSNNFKLYNIIYQYYNINMTSKIFIGRFTLLN